MRWILPVFAIAAIAGLTAACAASAARSVAPNEVPGIAGRDCEYLPDREGDSPALSTSATGAIEAPVTLSVRYGPEGELAWVREVGVPQTPAGVALASRVEALVAPAAEPEWGYRLRFAPGRPPERLAGIYCEAALPEGTRFMDPSRIPPATMGTVPRTSGSLRMAVEVRVDPDGRPRDPRVRVHSEISHFHGPLRESAMSHRYLPALHDGFAVAGTFEFESEVRFRVTRR